ncbi:MAG: hypothetical protein MN733_21390, partial [Nitrososphaera sp.]|nr:hypothetical protein [Nitrososphaera sp.]
MRRFNSRAAAVILLILAVVVSGATLAKKMEANLGGGKALIIVSATSVREPAHHLVQRLKRLIFNNLSCST